MRIATLRSGSASRAAVQAVGGVGPWIDVAEAARSLGDPGCPATVRGLLDRDGPQLGVCRRVLEAAAAGELPTGVTTWSGGGVRFAPPVPDPGAFLDFYAFEEHVRRARAQRGLEMSPEWYQHPVYYRSNQRAMLGDGEDVWFPAGETMIDFELELAVVIGAPLASPSAVEAVAAIAGYCLLNDWSARAIQREVMKVGLGPNKGKDFATSLGPWIVTGDELGEPRELELTARVNGEQWSQGRVGAMNWSWGELLAFAGEGVRFEPGDVFGSGTIGGGCGLELGRFLAPGDRVELDGGEMLGVLRGTVRQREGRR